MQVEAFSKNGELYAHVRTCKHMNITSLDPSEKGLLRVKLLLKLETKLINNLSEISADYMETDPKQCHNIVKKHRLIQITTKTCCNFNMRITTFIGQPALSLTNRWSHTFV